MCLVVVIVPHRNDLSTDPDGLMSGVAEEVSVDGDGLSLPFVGPACVVPEHTTADETMCQDTRAVAHRSREGFPAPR